MTQTNFISAEETLELIGTNTVSIMDASWYLPAQKRNAREEYASARIPGAVFFDIDDISDQFSPLPHMLPTPEEFAKKVSLLGISHKTTNIVYDGPGIFSAPRVWWTLKVMGAQDVRILKGGFDQWKVQGFPLETGNPNPPLAKIFEPDFDTSRVVSQSDLEENLKTQQAVVLDARPAGRFDGIDPEPRSGLRSGHIPGSKSLPFTQLLENGEMKSPDQLREIFASLDIGENQPIVTSCGSGVTAAIISLALAEIGYDDQSLYDGSWAEWGKEDGPPIATK